MTLSSSPTATRYRDDPAALAALVRDDQVHRDVYLSPEVFALEMERLWSRAWIYAGHDSQLPRAGDAVRVSIAARDRTMRREADGRIVVDGAAAVESWRGFVFCRIAARGPSLPEWLGPMREVLDNVADRSPSGRLRIAGGTIRSLVRSNWKIYLENINDTVHPVSTHESAASAASQVWSGHGPDEPKPMSMQQMLPFANGYQFFEEMGGRVMPNGHSILGTKFSIHTKYDGLDGYEAAMLAAYGRERTDRILAFTPQNAVFYPSLALKGSPTLMRVLRPIAPDRTILEAWAFQPEDAPDVLLQRAVMYNRLVFSPWSVVGHDDQHLFETIQQALRSQANPWVSLHRGHAPGERDDEVADVGGTDERLMRNQYRHWRRMMTTD